MLICPLCQQLLRAHSGGATCPAQHHFDQARQGYYNLLAAQHKNSKNPGDPPAMVAARQQFLAAGHYAPIAQRLLAIAKANPPDCWLDLGCGEGYYTQRIATEFARAQGYALDIARAAIVQGARLNKQLTWLVASSARIPLAPESCTLVLSLFSPVYWAELLRVLHPQGYFLRVVPTAAHLYEMRARLYPEVRTYKEDQYLSEVPAALTLIHSDTLAFSLTLDAKDRSNLLAMTPHGWRAKPEQRAAFIAEPLEISVSVRYHYFARRPT